MTDHLPTIYLTRMAQRHPGCWQEVDRLRADRGKGLPDWPSWCFLPLAGSYAILSGGGDNRLTVETAGEIAAFGALAAWRTTQGIYEIHPTVAAAIQETPLDGALPVEVLHCLPEWCVYLRTPWLNYLGRVAAGFFAYLECDAGTGREELRLVVDCPPGLYGLLPIHLDRGGLEPGLAAAKEEALRHATSPELTGAIRSFAAPTALADLLAPLVNMVLYVCAENAEIRDRAGQRERPTNPRPAQTKKGPRIFPAARPTTWNVGFRLGVALDAAGADRGEPQGGTHASPRPHVRRAHWHHFWTGPKTSQTIILRWLPPIAVNVDEEHGLVPTVRTVGEDER